MSGIRPVSMATYTPSVDSYVQNVSTDKAVNGSDGKVQAEKESEEKSRMASDRAKSDKKSDNLTADKKKKDEKETGDILAEEKLALEKSAQKRRELMKELQEEEDDDSDEVQNLQGMSVDDLELLYAQRKISRRVYDQEIAKRESLAEATTEKQNFDLWEQGFETAAENGRADVVKDIINPQNS